MMNSYWIGSTDGMRLRDLLPEAHRCPFLYYVAVAALTALNGYLLGYVLARMI